MAEGRKTNGRYLIERVRVDDIRPVLRLAWAETEEIIPAPFFQAVARQQREYFRVVREASTGTVRGFIIAARQPGSENNVLLLAVDPTLLGQGLRRALINDVQGILKREGERGMSVEIPAHNQSLLTLFRTEGFEVVGLESGSPTLERLVLYKPLR